MNIFIHIFLYDILIVPWGEFPEAKFLNQGGPGQQR